MEICKFLAVVLVAVVVICSVQATSQGVDNQVIACMQKLIPCQAYIHAANPPPSCCEPMKEMLANDAPCLCTVFNTPLVLKTLNLTKENALDLPKACGANPDVSICSKIASSSPTPSPGSTSGSSSVHAVSFIGLTFVSALVPTILFF